MNQLIILQFIRDNNLLDRGSMFAQKKQSAIHGDTQIKSKVASTLGHSSGTELLSGKSGAGDAPLPLENGNIT